MPSLNDYTTNHIRQIGQAIDFVKSNVFVKRLSPQFDIEEFVPPEGSNAPGNMFVVTTYSSKQGREQGDFFKKIIGFDANDMPYIYEKPTYSRVTPGVVLGNADPQKGPALVTLERQESLRPGQRGTSYLNPLQHIFSVLGSVYGGFPGNPEDPEELFENLNAEQRAGTAISYGAKILTPYGKEIVIPGMPYSTKAGESSSQEIQDLTRGGPLLAIMNVRSNVFNDLENTEDTVQKLARAGQVGGLPPMAYGVDRVTKTHRLASPESIGYYNPITGETSAFTSSPTKAAHIGKRPYNEMMIFSGDKKAYSVESEQHYVEETATLRQGDVRGKQLVMRTLIPLIGAEGSRASGSAHWQAPEELLREVRSHGKRAQLEATFRSTLNMEIDNVLSPEDLFVEVGGTKQFRFQMADRFTEAGLKKRNVIGAHSNVRVADFIGYKEGRVEKTPLNVTTKERHSAVLGKSLYLPVEWLDNPDYKAIIENSVMPAAKELGLQIEYRTTTSNKNQGRPVSLSLDVAQGEPMALKNWSKATNTPIDRGMMGLWRPGANGNLVLEKAVDAIMPFKSREGVMWSAFRIADRKRQKTMLYSLADKNTEKKKIINEYYSKLEEGSAPSLDVLGERLGIGSSLEVLEAMSDKILGGRNETIVKKIGPSGVPIIDEQVLAKQQRAQAKYGIGRDWGYAPVGKFTEETRTSFINTAISNLVKYNSMTEERARAAVDVAYKFIPGKTLKDGTRLWQGFEIQEAALGDVAQNPISEMSGEAKEKNAIVESQLLASGNKDIVEFRDRTRQERNQTQKALDALADSFSATDQKAGKAGRYVHVTDEATDPNGLNWNRQDFLSMLDSANANSRTPVEALEVMRKTIEDKFGRGLGIDVNTPFEGKVFFPRLEAIQRLDSDATVLNEGDETEVSRESIARLPNRIMNAMYETAQGIDTTGARASYERLSRKFMKSENLEKETMGIYSPYETNTMLQPGEIWLSKEALQRYYKIMGGNEHNTGELKKYLEMFLGPQLAVAQRQPNIAHPNQAGYGSVAPFKVLTGYDKGGVGGEIQADREATGFRGMDVVASPELAEMLGDSDADKFGVYLAVGKALGGNTGEWLSMMGGLSSEERHARLQRVVDEQAPEIQTKIMEYFFGGGKPNKLALEKSPTALNQTLYLRDLLHGDRAESVWNKGPTKELNAVLAEKVQHASEQKQKAMGDTHNQLIRRLESAGMAVGLEPKAYYNAMAAIGTKFGQAAVDQGYQAQTFVKLLKMGFLSERDGQLGISFGVSKNLSGEEDFQGGLRWNSQVSFNQNIGRIANILMETDKSLTARDLAYMFGDVSEKSYKNAEKFLRLRKGAKLSQEESNALGENQIEWYETDVMPRFEAIMKLPMDQRGEAINDLVRGGVIGERSIMGVAIKERLGEYLQNKDASKNPEDIEKGQRIRNAAGKEGIDLEGTLYAPNIRAGSDVFEILKGDKNTTGLGAWKYAGNFAASAKNWADVGIADNPVIQHLMKFWGGMHGLFYGEDESGNTVVKSALTNKIISNDAELKEFQDSVRHVKPVRLTAEQRTQASISQSAIRGSEESEIRQQFGDEATDRYIASGGRIPGSTSGGGNGINQPPVTTYASPDDPIRRSEGTASSRVYRANQGTSDSSIQYAASRFESNFSGIGTIISNINSIGMGRQGNMTLAGGRTAIERWDALSDYNNPNRRAAMYYTRHDPNVQSGVRALQGLRKDAGAAWERFGSSTEAGVLAGLMTGQTMRPQEMSYPWVNDIRNMLPFIDEVNFGPDYWRETGDTQTYLEFNALKMNRYSAGAMYYRNPSVVTKQGMSRADYAIAEKERNLAVEELEKYETSQIAAGEIGEEHRLSPAFANAMSNPEGYASALQAKKTALTDKYGGKLTKDWTERIDLAEAAQESLLKPRQEFDSPQARYAVGKQAIDSEFLGEMTKYSQALRDIRKGTDEYLKTLNLSDEQMRKFKKSIEDGSFAQEAKNKEIQQSRNLALKTIRDAMGSDAETGDFLSNTEMRRIKTGRYGDVVKERLGEYLQTFDEEAAIEEQGKKRSFASRFGRGARGILSGFGLMYLRSIGNMIAGTGDTGYAESVQYNAALNQAMASQYGAQEGYNPDADLAGYKALRGGGGKRLINQWQTNMYRDSPGLMDVGKGVFAAVAGGGSTAWLMQQLEIGGAGPVSIAAGAAIGIGAYAINQWGKSTDQASWIAGEGDKFATFVNNRTGSGTGERNNLWDYAGVATQLYGYTAAKLLNIAPEWRKNFDENSRLLGLREEAQRLVDSGEEKTLARAYKKLGYSDEDIFSLSKAKGLEILAKMMPGISTEGRVASEQQLLYFGVTPEDKDVPLLNKLGQAYDSGIDLMGAAQGMLEVTGNKYAENRERVLQSLAYSGKTGEEIEKLKTVVQLASQLGPEFSQWAFGATVDEITAKENAIPGTIGTGQSRIDMGPGYEKYGNLLAGPNADIATMYAQTQAYQLRAGIAPDELPDNLMQVLSPEEREKYISERGRKGTGYAVLESLSAKSGISTLGLRNKWESVIGTGSLIQQDAFLNMISNPGNPMAMGAYVNAMGISGAQAQAYAQSTTMTAAGAIPNSAMLFTGANQNGIINGRPWGQASLAMPGLSANYVANQIWQQQGGWANAGGSAQGAINAMVNGIQVGGQTFYGEQGLQGWQNQFSYNQAMAQIGIQMKQIALSSAFTTGQGLSAYGFEEGAGFWSIEDRQRALGRQQQEASFANQAWNIAQSEKRLGLSEKYYGQNRVINRQQTMMQRGWAQEDWAYQQNVRDLQWGWKQEDFQENVRFMTGRDRRLAERQMKRDTIMHDLEGEQIDKQKNRQQELWKLEDRRFELEKKQHDETLKMQREEIQHDKQMFEQAKRFYAEEKKLEDESIKLQRAYYLEQQKLQKESAGIQAYGAQVQKDLNDAMLIYNDYTATQKGNLDLLTMSMGTLQLAIQALIDTMNNPLLTPEQIKQNAQRGSTPGTQTINLYVDGSKLASVIADYIY